MECARTRFLRQSNSLEPCPDWPEKRPSKSIHFILRNIDILDAAAFRCSHSCLSRLFFFLVKMMQIYFWKPIFRGRSLLLKVSLRIWSYAHRCFVKNAWFFVMGISVESIKSQGDFPHKWIFGNRHISCSSWVCFRRRQTGVHQTPLSVDPNEHKLLTWLQPWQNAAWWHCQK